MERLEDIIGPNIRAHRTALGLTQKELGERMGYTKQGAISNWELGRVLPLANNLCDLADALNCSVDELLGRK